MQGDAAEVSSMPHGQSILSTFSGIELAEDLFTC